MPTVGFDLGPRPEFILQNPAELAKILKSATDIIIELSEVTGSLDDVADGATSIAFTPAERTKLSGIETGATADQTGAEIKTLYEAEANTNAFTDAEQAKLAGIETGATADQTNSEILAAWVAAASIAIADIIQRDGSVAFTGPPVIPSYTVATLPSVGTAQLIYVSDETGGATVAFSDGTNWRRMQDRAIVS